MKNKMIALSENTEDFPSKLKGLKTLQDYESKKKNHNVFLK